MTFARAASLASWRAEVQPDERQCLLLFGVGPDTLERIEAGEVEPEPDVEARILRVILDFPGDRQRMGGLTSTPAADLQPSAAGVFSEHRQ